MERSSDCIAEGNSKLDPPEPSVWRSRTLGQVVKAWRTERGLTQRELIARSDITKGFLSMLETDKIRSPHDQLLLELASGLTLPYPVLLLRLLPGEYTATEA